MAKKAQMTPSIKITQSDAHAAVEALTFTVEALTALPIDVRPNNSIGQMSDLIELLVGDDKSRVQAQRVARHAWAQVIRHIKITTERGGRPADKVSAGEAHACGQAQKSTARVLTGRRPFSGAELFMFVCVTW
jgi:hypothetical protein